MLKLTGKGVLALFLFLFLSALSVAYATAAETAPANTPGRSSDSLSITGFATPSAMVVPGEAKIDLTLTYYGDTSLENVRICREDGTVLREAAALASEEATSLQFSETIVLTPEQLDQNGIHYLITYDAIDEQNNRVPRQRTTFISVIKQEADPKIEFTRTLSSDHVPKGSEVTISYRVRNTGNVSLKNLVLVDELCGEVGTLDLLEPGKKQTFSAKVTIDQTSVSRPSIRYTFDGNVTDITVGLKASTVYLADEQLDIQLEADKNVVSPGEVITLRLKIANNGNVSYENLRITDKSLGEVGTITSEIKPGDEYLFSKTVSLKTTTTFLFDVSGRNANGSEYEESSNMLTIAVSPAIENISVNLSASAQPARLSEPGPVTFTVRIDNQGDIDIRNAVLSEQKRGEMKKLAVLAPGVTEVEYTYDVDAADNTFKFLVELSDAKGGKLTLLSNPIAVEITDDAEATMAAALTPVATTTTIPILGEPYQLDDRSAFESMMFGVLVILGTMVLFIIIAVSIRRRRVKRLRLLHQRRLRRLSREDKAEESEAMRTRPHAPVNPEDRPERKRPIRDRREKRGR